MTRYVVLAAGDPAPGFSQRSPATPAYAFDTAAGRYLVLGFILSAGQPAAARALVRVAARRDLFDDRFASFFAVSTDPADETEARLANRPPGFRVFWDFDLTASRLYGAAPAEAGAPGPGLALFVVIDPTMRVIDVFPLTEDDAGTDRLIACLDALPPPGRFAGIEIQAPILYLPRVFEPALCAELIALYEAKGGAVSGVMRSVEGKTVGVHDTRHKSRRDLILEDPALIRTLQNRVQRRIVPEIAKVHQFRATRMERYIVGCYAADEGGHFSQHRDNTTPATKHRRFAVSVNLNDDFEGGEVSFPEYGPRGFKAPAGGAVVFSCSLLHAVSKVTAGRRYAFLPFLYDDAAAEIRAANQHSLAT